LRTTILAAIVLALAGAQLVWPGGATTTMFVVDGSDSISPATRVRAEDFIAAALRLKPAGDRAGIVVFGSEAIVERPPAADVQFSRTTVQPPGEQTDIARALRLSLALLPGETRKRIVLLSDGAETRGAALEQAALARAAGVPIETVSLIGPPAAEDTALEGLEAPSAAREGQRIRLVVQVRSGIAGTARLQLLLDRRLVLDTDVRLQAGLTRVPLTVAAPAPGFHAWEARITSAGDTVGANNVQFGFTEVRGQPRVLLVEGERGRADNLRDALLAARLNPEVVAPDGLPSSLIGMDAYDVIVLVDVAHRALPRRAAELLPAYVRELGRGLVMVGGEDSYAAGGYLDTPVETALPVEMRTRGVKITPDIALVLVIDRSGSMSGEKLELAKEGAAQAYATLTERDQIGVVAFDSVADWAVDLQAKPPADAFLQQLGSIGEGGGTDLRPGLELATAALETAQAKIKHVVLLTDGQAEYNYDDVIERMKSAGITLTSVGIEDYDPNLEKVAPETGGVFYPVDDVNDVPRLFFDESLRVARRGIVEREFRPLIAFPAPEVRELQAAPPLYGYNAVTPKDSAEVVLQSDDGDPILAQWQYGLGRAVAWTSDFKGQWAKDWVAWAGFGRFAGQLIAGVLPSPSPQGFEASAGVDGTALAVELRADAQDGGGRTGLAPVGRIVAGDGSVVEVPLHEVAPGRYRGTTGVPEPGVYRTQVLVRGEQGQELGVVSLGAVVPPSAEYLQRDGNLALLSQLSQLTGGRTGVTAAQVWDTPAATPSRAQPIAWPLLWLAVLLWPLDIAVRRLLLPRPRAVEAWLRERTARRPPQPTAELGRRRARVRAATQAPAAPKAAAPPPQAATPPPAPTAYDWRRTRRGVVERPDQDKAK